MTDSKDAFLTFLQYFGHLDKLYPELDYDEAIERLENSDDEFNAALAQYEDEFDCCYEGEFDDMTEFAEAYYCKVYSSELENLPDCFQNYIDWERIGRDLEISGDYDFINSYVFRSE